LPEVTKKVDEESPKVVDGETPYENLDGPVNDVNVDPVKGPDGGIPGTVEKVESPEAEGDSPIKPEVLEAEVNTQNAPGKGWENDGQPQSNEKLEAEEIRSESSSAGEIKETLEPFTASRRRTNDKTQRRGSMLDELQSKTEIAAFDIEKRPSQLEVTRHESSQSRK
jgi:hypothetical protein